MTPQEAHEYMENEIRCIQRSKICDRDCAKCKLVKEDKPLIEAYGFAISALEKQIPKKPIYEDIGNVYGAMKRTCAKCGDVCLISEGAKPFEHYCRYCGQALDFNSNGSDTE